MILGESGVAAADRNDPAGLEIGDLAARLRRRALSAAELAERMLARIAGEDGHLHSFAFLDPELVRRQAREADVALDRGETRPLLGVPIGVKDLFSTRDMPTRAGMRLPVPHRPFEDATVVARLRQAGAVIIGKLEMTEGAFALHHPEVAPPLNPWDPALWPGASSSGAGVAVAAGLCHGAIGSDTGGSIRFPCAANGLTGLKPGWGAVSRHGAFELAASLDHVGPIARSARDAALLYAVIGGHDPADPTSRPGRPAPYRDDAAGTLRGIRIGFDPRWNEAGCEPATARCLAEAQQAFRQLGASLEALRLPEIAEAVAHWELIAGVETAVAHADLYPRHAGHYGPALTRLIEIGRAASAGDYQRGLLSRMELRGRLDALLSDVDLLIAPVQPFDAPTLDRLGALASDPDANARLIGFTAPFNLSGHPAISLPGRPTDAGAPIGFQLVAGQGREPLLLSAAMAFQQATEWHRRSPDSKAGTH
ncbi:amidase [Rhizorhabdus histidinilytica]|uniref:Amidase n=1 Tax=Rhizorhabdus histidinilytica TaxID=439228 RepID=A0A1T5D1I0_9SPHN|nr:amidase [Rhizorhabdus histidinilytica]SKB65360.1 amidase [Rhizorhabdus histidinilytica]